MVKVRDELGVLGLVGQEYFQGDFVIVRHVACMEYVFYLVGLDLFVECVCVELFGDVEVRGVVFVDGWCWGDQVGGGVECTCDFCCAWAVFWIRVVYVCELR